MERSLPRSAGQESLFFRDSWINLYLLVSHSVLDWQACVRIVLMGSEICCVSQVLCIHACQVHAHTCSTPIVLFEF